MSRALLIAAVAIGGACSSGTSAPTPVVSTPFVPAVRTVGVSPAAVQVTVGAATTLVATVRDQRDSLMTGKTVVWSSSATAVATVNTSGVVTGVSAGTATIAAAVDAVTSSAVVTVVAAPTPVAGGLNADGFYTTVPTIDLNVILARPTANAVSVSIWSATTRDVTLTFLPDNRSVVQHVTASTLATVELTGLVADRAYTFTATAPGAATVSGQFRTARTAGTTWRFDMQADSHLDSNTDPAIYANTLANMAADAPDFLIDLGDTFMTDKYADYHNAAPQYYAQRYWLGLVGKTMPLYLVQGNHDGELGWYTGASWAAGMRQQYFLQPLASAFYNTALTPRNYFAWTWGDATFIALDPFFSTMVQPTKAGTSWAWTLGKEQYDWLVGVLQKNTSPYTFVFLHHLVGGAGTEARGGTEASVFSEWGGLNADGTAGFAAQRPGWSKPIHDLLVQYKVAAVFHGHDHLYVHQQRDGIAYQEVPQPSFAREGATSSAVDYGYLSGTLLGSSGHLRVTISPAKATVEYVRSRLTTGNGDVVDKYDLSPAVRP